MKSGDTFKTFGAFKQSENQNIMKTYDETLKACIRYFDANGQTQETCDKLKSMLPGAWAAELIADALDALEGGMQ